MSDSEFAQHKSALSAHLTHKDSNLAAMGRRAWQEIIDSRLHFHVREATLAQLETITLPELIEFYRAHLVDSTKIRQLRVSVVKPGDAKAVTSDSTLEGEGALGVRVGDVETFRVQAPVFEV
eukprot:c10897_g1_i1.p3 GENE.c10897_g1_i1~~c10897_g1_i1.p3  ORF type:complete len:122 (+),score=36.13 c10897_g1_i1:190-555(+)